MKNKVYNFDKKQGYLGDIEFTVTDYFQYYHTGIEDLIPNEMLILTERYNNERSEVLAYQLLNSENLADTILAINNDVFLWDSPYDNDMFELNIDMIFRYIQKVNKSNMSQSETYRYQNIARQYVSQDDTMLRSVLVPKMESTQKIARILKDYLRNRKVT